MLSTHTACAGLGAGLIGLIAGAAPADEPMRPVLIEYASAPTPADITMLEATGAEVTRRYHIVPGLAARIPAGLELDLVDDPRIVAIDADAPGEWFDEYDRAWGVGRIGSETVHLGGLRGDGVRIGVIDSGIYPTHPDLEDNYVFGYDFALMSPVMVDLISHGTHVSGTAAASGNGFGVVGVAPTADICMLKVGDFAPTSGAVISALQWAVDNGVRVTNSSFGVPHSSLLEMAYGAAWNAGIVNVAASGNSSERGVGAPARYATVIAVGAVDEFDHCAGFSTYGPEVDLCAPGVHIVSTFGGTGYHDQDGTSMASPHVAGAAALLIAAGIPDAGGDGRINDDVVARLIATATDLGPAGHDERYGWGMVNPVAATDFCSADLTGDGRLDFFDFLAFQSMYAAGDPAADFTGDGRLDFFDFLAFQNAFSRGCD